VSEVGYWIFLGLICLIQMAALIFLMRSQIKSLAQRDEILLTLTNLVASRDPMTFASLEQQRFKEPDIYVPKNDESEARQWEELTGEGVPDDYTDDLRELGLRG